MKPSNFDPPTEDPRLRDDGFDSWYEQYKADLGLDQMSDHAQYQRFQQWVRDAQYQAGEDLAATRAEDRASSWAGYW